MSAHFDRVAIIGVGLLGASLGLALKARGLAARVAGAGRRRSSLDEALRVGAVDEAFLEVAEAVNGADLVVIATPAALVCAKLDEMQPLLAPDAIVTDVASTKARICAHAAGLWPRDRRFVGSHPMAGSEKFGPSHGRADFYENSVCLVESAEGLDVQAREQVLALWRGVGARVLDIEPARPLQSRFAAYCSMSVTRPWRPLRRCCSTRRRGRSMCMKSSGPRWSAARLCSATALPIPRRPTRGPAGVWNAMRCCACTRSPRKGSGRTGPTCLTWTRQAAWRARAREAGQTGWKVKHWLFTSACGKVFWSLHAWNPNVLEYSMVRGLLIRWLRPSQGTLTGLSGTDRSRSAGARGTETDR